MLNLASICYHNTGNKSKMSDENARFAAGMRQRDHDRCYYYQHIVPRSRDEMVAADEDLFRVSGTYEGLHKRDSSDCGA